MQGVRETGPVICGPSKGITRKLIKDFNLDDGDEGSEEGGWKMDIFNSRVVKGMR